MTEYNTDLALRSLREARSRVHRAHSVLTPGGKAARAVLVAHEAVLSAIEAVSNPPQVEHLQAPIPFPEP